MIYFTQQDLKAGGNFIMLCGAPGSGKEEFVKRLTDIYNDEWTIVSLNDIRHEFNGSYSANYLINDILERAHTQIRMGLENGHNVIYNSTNCYPRDRKNVMKVVNRTDSKGYSVCLVSTASLIECLRRNAEKDIDRQLSEENIERMYIQLKQTPPSLYEGYDAIGRF